MKNELKVGDYVGFKYDIEQYGEIIAIDGTTVSVRATQGEYVHQGCSEYCESCFADIDLDISDLFND